MGAAARVLRTIRSDLPLQDLIWSLRRCVGSLRNRRRENEAVENMAGDPVTARVVTIIPTYRRPELLGAAVASALEQGVDDHAVVVVSDGAPVTAELPDDPRVHVMVLGENIGIAGIVRNIGIRCSRSEYIAFLDDDNQWRPGHLTSLLAALEEGAAIAYSGLIRVLPDGREYDRVLVDFDRRRLRTENYIDINTVAVRRAGAPLFSRRRREALEAPGEDWTFAWRMTRRAHVATVPECSVRYLINPQSYFWPGFAEHADQQLQVD